MKTQRILGRLVCLLVVLLAAVGELTGQQADVAPATQPPASEPASSQPASAPAPEPNPLPSPTRMMQFFYAALEDGRMEDAALCLDFSQVDAEVRRADAGDFVLKLKGILDRLEAERLFDPAGLPDEPDAVTPLSIGKDPLLLVLERQKEPEADSTVRLWRFSASTVKEIPETHARLEELTELTEPAGEPVEAPPVEAEGVDVNRLRSPYHMMEFFLVKVADAERNTGAYVDALRCLDFALVEPDDIEAKGPEYVDGLAVLLARLREDGTFDREALEKQPPRELDTVTIGGDPLLIHLVRQADGCWRFSAATVKRVPEMLKALRELAQEAAAEGQPAVIPAGAPVIRQDTSSAQGTMNLFLTAMGNNELATAVRCFDLSLLSETERSYAKILAGKLLMVLNRQKVIVLQDVSSDPEDPEPYTVLKHTAGRVEIDQKRSRDPDGTDRRGEWLFTAATVGDIERLYEAFESEPVLPEFKGDRVSFWTLPSLYVREYWVPPRFKRPAAGLQLWQWVGLGLVLCAGLVFRRLCGLLLPRFGRYMLATEGAAILPQALRRALLPTSTLVMFLALWGGLQFLDLGATIMSWTWWALRIVLVVVSVYAIYRLLDVASDYFSARAARTSSRLDDVLVPLVYKTAKVLVVAVGVLLVAATFGLRVGPLLAGFGLGGLAFGLAAQDTLKNFFGSVNVVLDRPFQVGDWVKVGDVEGTVESVGLRSSRLRTFYNSQITVPNSEIMNARVDNMGRRRYRRISTRISVTYSTTPEQLEAFCEGIRELIRRHPYTRKDYYHAYVNEFAASAINILLYCFHETPDWSTELRERHRLYLDIVRLANRLGVEFAFPTQTVHLHHESSPPSPPAPSPPGPPAESEGAMQFGREEAARIVREAFGEVAEKPPPVEF